MSNLILPPFQVSFLFLWQKEIKRVIPIQKYEEENGAQRVCVRNTVRIWKPDYYSIQIVNVCSAWCPVVGMLSDNALFVQMASKMSRIQLFVQILNGYLKSGPDFQCYLPIKVARQTKHLSNTLC